MPDMNAPVPPSPEDLADRMTVEEKVALVSGGSAWGTAAVPGIGLRSIVLSDGPSGVRGALWDERLPSACLPSATALAASWDLELAREYGTVVAGEARAKGVDVVLGPTVNLHRSPLGGRHFEAFSEDPRLTADLAAAYVAGVQAQGVGAAIKHFVANDFETDRFAVDVQVGDRALRELYLLAFERAVTEAGAWLVLSAYNAVNGTTATESPLLTDPLTTTWGFDGVVVSDWTAVRSLESARQQQHLAMPGPAAAWSDRLVTAVRDGDVPMPALDEKVRRILRLAARVGALEGFGPSVVPEAVDAGAFARRVAAEGMVLVANTGVLPLQAASVRRVAVIGEHAERPRVQGGGSATVIPHYEITPVDGIRRALPEAVLDLRVGAVTQDHFAPLDPARMTNPVTGGPGARYTSYGADGTELYAEDRFAGFILDYGREDDPRVRASVGFRTRYTPERDGELRFGFASPGTGRLFIDGALVLEATIEEDPDQIQDFFAARSITTPHPVRAGVALELRYEFVPGTIIDGVPNSLAVTFGILPAPRTEEEDRALIAEAVQAAEAAEIAIVIVATGFTSECEGFDRTDLRLPGRQDELVAAVAAANPRTVVVVNAGAPVEMPWRDDVAAVLLTWFGGQEYGTALADVLVGAVEPGGRLPTTWPARLADAPVTDVQPVDGVVRYDEGIHIGYRAWARTDVAPAYPFGHGLGYTTWAIDAPTVTGFHDGIATVTATVRNTGARPGKHVVQVYARRQESVVDRPALWLVGYALVRAAAGSGTRVTVEVSRRALAYWEDGWRLEAGDYELLIGATAAALGPAGTVTVDRDELLT